MVGEGYSASALTKGDEKSNAGTNSINGMKLNLDTHKYGSTNSSDSTIEPEDAFVEISLSPRGVDQGVEDVSIPKLGEAVEQLDKRNENESPTFSPGTRNKEKSECLLPKDSMNEREAGNPAEEVAITNESKVIDVKEEQPRHDVLEDVSLDTTNVDRKKPAVHESKDVSRAPKQLKALNAVHDAGLHKKKKKRRRKSKKPQVHVS